MTASHAQADVRGPSRATDLLPISNTRQLLDHGLPGLRRLALDVVASGIRAASPAAAVDRLVELRGSVLHAGGHSFDLAAMRSVVVLGAGKASLSIAGALDAKLGARISGGLVVCRRGASGVLRHVEVLEADHPIPSRASLAAGQRLIGAAGAVRPGDLVITAFTGGSSALACAPAEGVSFEAKQNLHGLLLASGAPIAEVNAVRKHVSALKGGRLAAQMRGATLLNLTMSDVPSGLPDLMCDPVVQDTSNVADAIAILKQYGLWNDAGPEVRRHLESPLARSPVLNGHVAVTTVVLMSGADVVAKMAARAGALGCEPVVLGSTFEGEAVHLGGLLGSLAHESSMGCGAFRPGSLLVGAGGESTVTLPRHGVPARPGGPNQELALGFARAIGRGHAAVAGVFVDSDGSDGGTDAAGACADSLSATRATECGLDLRAAILEHDSYRSLERLGDLVITGPTGTNVADLWAIAIGAAAPEAKQAGGP
jgi:glycerate 2-kinase